MAVYEEMPVSILEDPQRSMGSEVKMPDPRADSIDKAQDDIGEALAEIDQLRAEREERLKNQVKRLIKMNKDMKVSCQKVPTKKDWYNMINRIEDPFLCETMISRLAAKQCQLKEELDLNFKSHTPKEIKAI